MVKMERKVVTGITLAMLFMGMLPLAFKVQPVAALPAINWWPMFHHDPMHTGYSTSTAPTTNQTLWTYKTGGAVGSSPAVVNGVVFVGSSDDNVYALNATTGAKVWNYTTGGSVASSLAVVNGVVYVGSADNRTYALNAATGALVWNYTTGGSVNCLTVVNGVVYVSDNDYNVYALNATTITIPASSRLLWKYTTGGPVGSCPAVSGGVLYVGDHNGDVYALNATTGALMRGWPFTYGGNVPSSPAVVGGVVYVGTDNAIVYALNATTGAVIWSYATGGAVPCSPAVAGGVVYVGSENHNVYALNASATAVKRLIWSYTTGAGIGFSSPAVAGGMVFIGSDDNRTYALNATTGVLVWKYKTGGMVDPSSPAVANGVVFVGSEDHNVYAFGPSTNWPMFHHDVLHTGYSTSTAPTTNQTLWNYTAGGPVESSPAVVNGVVYVGSDDNNVYALNATTGAKIWNYTAGGAVESSPAVANGMVFVVSDNGFVYALNAKTGHRIWNYPIVVLIPGWASYPIGTPVESSPTVSNGVVYVGNDNGSVFAFSARNGTLYWQQTTVVGNLVSSPAVSGGVVYVCSTNRISDAVYALYASNGTIKWHTPGPGAPMLSSPAVVGGVVYFTCDDWTCACNATTGSPIWSYCTFSSKTGYGPYSSPAVAYIGPNYSPTTVVYVGGINLTHPLGEVYALNATCLSPAPANWGGHKPSCLWNYTTGTPWVDSSPAVANGMVFVGSDDNRTYALNATTGVLVWKYKTGGAVFSSPAVAGSPTSSLVNLSSGVVYVGSDDDHVYAFQTSIIHPVGGFYPVGGIYVTVNKLELLAPYIALASTILAVTAATGIYVKRKKKKQ
jgi:outer membrane protein assembly factor BamB